MSQINIGGNSYTTEQVIQAIAESNDSPESNLSLPQVVGLIQSLMVRIEAIEQRLPFASSGFGVVTSSTETGTLHRVQTTDPQGRTVIVTYEVPTNP